MIVIETHTFEGVKWGLSTSGSSPQADEYLPVSSKQETFRIKAAYDMGDIMPYLKAAGAVVQV